MNNIKYHRARIVSFYDFISKAGDVDLPFLRNGLVPKKDDVLFSRNILQRIDDIDTIGDLSLVELMTFSTWFEIHPEKIAGKEYQTTSLAFPVRIKGTKEDVINTIEKSLQKNKKRRLLIAKAQALKLKLKLLNK